MKDQIDNIGELHWLHALYDQAPIAIGVYLGREYIIEFANPMMRQIWGRTPEEVLHKGLFLAMPEFQSQGFKQIFDDVFNTGIPYEGSGVPAIIHKEGKEVLNFFNLTYQPLRNSEGIIVGLIQTATEVTDLILSKKRAERNEEILNLSLKSSNIGTWYMNLVSGETERSVEHDKIMGYQEPLEAWSTDMFFEKVIPDDFDYAKKSYVQGLEDGELNFEVRISWPDNTIHWIVIKGKTSYNLNKQPIFISGVILDITDQKEIEEKAREFAVEQAARKEAERQTQMLEQLFMDAPALICTLSGPDHVFTLVNPQYQNQLFPGRQLVGKSVRDALPELEGQQFVEMLDGVYQTGKAFIGTEVPLRFGRESVDTLETGYFNFVYQAHKDADDSIIGILVFAFEVTEQIRARKLIEKSEQNLTLALEAGNMGTWYLDLASGATVHSLEHDSIFGYDDPIPEWDFNRFLEHVLPDDREEVIQQFDLAKTSAVLNLEARILSADDKIKWIAVKGKAFYEQNKPVGMAGIVMDITSRKEGEWRLKELSTRLAESNQELKAANGEITAHVEKLSLANKQLTLINADLDNFIYTASHDLKAPISNIEGLMSMLNRQLPQEIKNNEVFNRILSSIQTSIGRFKNTIVELTDIAKLQQQVADVQLLQLAEVVSEVVLDLETTIRQSGAEVTLENQTCDPISFSYKNLKSVIYNLISNAIKYSAPDRVPKVAISCSQEKAGLITLTIADNGLGIKQKDIGKIFSIYKRFHTHVEGTGIGLYLVKRVIDNAEGYIEVESEENVGTAFKVHLPISKKDRA